MALLDDNEFMGDKPQEQQGLSDDEFFGQGQSAPTAQAQGPVSDEEFFGGSAGGSPASQGQQPAPGQEWSPAGSAAAGFAHGAAPAAGGMAAGIYAGGAATAVAGPIAGLAVGLGAGLGVGKIIEMGEDKFLALLGFDKDVDAARQSNPDTYDIAGMLPAAATLKGAGTLAARAIGAGIGGAAEIGAQAMGDEPWNLKKIGAAAGMGAALPSLNKAGEAIAGAGERVGAKISSNFVSARYRGGNTNPDIKAPEPASEEAVSHEPAPQEDDITVANDQPIVAAGIAVEQPKTPEIEGVGNPGQAAGSVAEAARPSEPARNYEKGQPQNQPQISDNKVLDTTKLGADTEAALTPDRGEAALANGASETGAPATAPARTDVLPQEPSPTIQPEQHPDVDNHTPQVRAQTQIPESLGPEETSRAQRDALEGIRQKIAAQQKGEDFQGLDHEPLSPEELTRLSNDRALLVKHGLSKGLEALNMLHPREQFNLLSHPEGLNIAKEVRDDAGTPASKEVMRPGATEARQENRATMDTGATAKSREIADRNQETIQQYRDLYEEGGPRSEHGQKFDASDVTNTRAAKAHTKPLWDWFVKQMGGDPFAKGSKVYLPQIRDEKTNEAIQYWRAVKKSATRNEHAGFMTLHETGKTAAGKAGMAELDAETKKIDDDITHRPQIEDAAADAILTKAKGNEAGREPIEKFDNSKGDESQRAAEQHQQLRDWVNGLDDDAYDALKGKHPDLETNVRATQDPEELLRNFQDDIPAGTEVRLKPKRLKLPTFQPESRNTVTLKGKNGEDMTVQRAPASEGKVLDKNSDEFKRLAAQYADQKVPDRKGRLESELAAAKRGTESDRVDPTSELATRKTIDGTETKPLMDHIERYLSDTSGAVKVPDFFKKFFNDPANPATPGASDGAVEYAKDLNAGFHALTSRIKNLKVEVMGQMNRAAEAGLSAAEHREIAIAEQDNRIGALPQKLKDFYQEHVVPVRERAMQAMRDYKEFDEENQTGANLPNLNAVTTKAYQPRFRLNKETFDKHSDDRFDPYSGKGLGDFSPNTEDRSLFALENGNDRMTVEVTKDPDTGEVGLKVHRSPNRVITIKNVPASFQGKLGDSLSLHVKGQKGTWTLDQATTQELAKATGMTHIENPVLAWSMMLDSVTQAHENAKLALAIKNDPKFKDLTTTDPDVAKERGYSTVTTHLPQFMTGEQGKKLYMADQVRWALDDFHKPGFGPGNEGLEGLRNFNTAMLKVFNTNAPLVHVLNELDLFTIGRGFKWISPAAYYNLAKGAPEAFKSVNTQDKLQAEMRSAGVNPMLASVKMRGMFERAAKSMGTEIEKEHSKWDPVARLWGVSTKELGQALYDASSDVTWRLSDYLTTMRYLEEKAGGDFGRKGKSAEEAAAATNKFMSDYHLANTVMGSRKLAQFIAEPAVTAFGRYKAGIFRTLGGMTRDLMSPSATKQERIDAVGQWLVMGALLYVAYPAMDKAVQAISGNENGELRRRGVSSVIDAGRSVLSGEKDPMVAGTRAWTPAPWLTIGKEVVTNRQFGDKPIIPQGQWPGVLPEAVGGAAEYAARTVAPPYGAASQTFSRKEGTPGSAVGALVADQFGASLPSDAAAKRAGQIEKVNAQAAKARAKRPNGMIPAAVNRVFND